MSVKQIKSLVQFARGTSVVLAELTTPIPDGVVIYSIDDGVFKLGNGSLKFSELPTLFTYQEMLSAQGGISGMFEEPQIDQNGRVVVVRHNSATNDIYYGVSDISLSSVLADLGSLETVNTTQTATIGTLLSKALMLDAGLNTANDNSIVVVNSRRYSNSGMTLNGMQNQINSQVTYTPGSHLEDVIFYTNANKDFVVDKLNLDDNSSCYVDIIGFNNSEASLVYGLTAANSSVVITNVSGSFFKVDFTNVTGGVKDNTPVVLIASINNALGTAKVEKAVACLVKRQKITVGIYSGKNDDYFINTIIDSNDNIICVGYTYSSGSGGYDALVVKFDSSLNIIARKVYGGTGGDVFHGVDVDSNDNIICVGNTSSEGGGTSDALVVKFDSSLNILARKIYGLSKDDYFQSVAVDSNDNIICAGYTYSEGIGSVTYTNCLVVKFDSSLNIIARKIYGGTSNDYFYNVAVDSVGNIICAGYTYSEGTGSPTYSNCLVVKFDSSLNIVARKRYGGADEEQFYGLTIDSNDNIICCGFTSSEGAGSPTYYNALVVKFDSSLNIVARKIYGGANNSDILISVTIDSDNNIICAGRTKSEGLGGINYGDAFVIKFDSSLNILARKRCGCVDDDSINGVVVDSNDNIICSGFTFANVGVCNAFVMKLPSDIPSGSFIGSLLSDILIVDSNLTLADSNLTLADSNLTLADSNATLTNSNLTLRNDNLTFITDIFN